MHCESETYGNVSCGSFTSTGQFFTKPTPETENILRI